MHLCFLALQFFLYMNFSVVCLFGFLHAIFRRFVSMKSTTTTTTKANPIMWNRSIHRYLGHKGATTFLCAVHSPSRVPVENPRNSSYFCCCYERDFRLLFFFAQIQIINIDKRLSRQMFIEFQIRFLTFWGPFSHSLERWWWERKQILYSENAFFFLKFRVSEWEAQSGNLGETCFCTLHITDEFDSLFSPRSIHRARCTKYIRVCIWNKEECWLAEETNSHTLSKLLDWSVIFFRKFTRSNRRFNDDDGRNSSGFHYNFDTRNAQFSLALFPPWFDSWDYDYDYDDSFKGRFTLSCRLRTDACEVYDFKIRQSRRLSRTWRTYIYFFFIKYRWSWHFVLLLSPAPSNPIYLV